MAVRTAGGALGRWYPVAAVLLAWEALSRSDLVSHRLVPGLADIAQVFAANMASGEIPFQAGISLGRALSGFGLAIAAGVVLGALMARVRWVESVFEPVFSFGYPVPKIALYPVFIFVFGLGSLSKVALIFLECLYPITVNTYYGFQSVDRKHLWSARNMGATRMQLFWRVLLPSAGPSIFSGLRVALPISLIVVIITEMIGESRGLGYYISYATASFEFASAYAGVVSIAAIGFVLDRLLIFVRNRIIFWERISGAHA
jgi:NitT/TauT family transport system permease protein